MTNNEDESELFEDNSRHCDDCDVLVEALRDNEQQCREAEDERAGISRCLVKAENPDGSFLEEQAHFAKMKKLEHRRDCALEVLLKHQKLEHPSG
jgi:hypothetical protein